MLDKSNECDNKDTSIRTLVASQVWDFWGRKIRSSHLSRSKDHLNDANNNASPAKNHDSPKCPESRNVSSISPDRFPITRALRHCKVLKA